MVSIISSIDTGHEDMIHDAEVDYYGLRLATCSSDNTVKVYDMRNGAAVLLDELRGHHGPVWQVAWGHPMHGGLLASCSYDRKILCYKKQKRQSDWPHHAISLSDKAHTDLLDDYKMTETENKVIVWREQPAGGGKWQRWHEYASHDSSVNSVRWAAGELGARLACGSSDGSVSVLAYRAEGGGAWEARKIQNAHAIGCNAVSWAPALAPDLVAGGGLGGGANEEGRARPPVRRLVSGGCDNLVKVWREDGDRWVEEAKLEVHSDWVRDVAWAPSVCSQKYVIASCSQDRRVVIWTSDDCKTWNSTVLHTFDDVVWNVSWSLNGNILAVSGGDNKITLWKQNMEGQWQCISDVGKGQGQINK